MTALKNVEKYFSTQAQRYQQRSSGFPWSWLRRKEMSAVFAALGDVRDVEVLEFGSGSGYYTRELIRRGARHVWAVDVSIAMLDALPNNRVTPVQGDAASITFDRPFPKLLCAGMLEFVADPRMVLANAAKHADRDALCVILAPRNDAFGRMYRRFHQAHGLAIGLFDKDWFDRAARETGWRVLAARNASLFSVIASLRRI